MIHRATWPGRHRCETATSQSTANLVNLLWAANHQRSRRFLGARVVRVRGAPIDSNEGVPYRSHSRSTHGSFFEPDLRQHFAAGRPHAATQASHLAQHDRRWYHYRSARSRQARDSGVPNKEAGPGSSMRSMVGGTLADDRPLLENCTGCQKPVTLRVAFGQRVATQPRRSLLSSDGLRVSVK